MVQSKKSLSSESVTDAVADGDRELLPVSEVLLRVERPRASGSGPPPARRLGSSRSPPPARAYAIDGPSCCFVISSGCHRRKNIALRCELQVSNIWT